MDKRSLQRRFLIGFVVVVALMVISAVCASAAVKYSGPPNVHCGYHGPRKFRCQDSGSSHAAYKALLFMPDEYTTITSNALLWTARLITLVLILAVVVAIVAILRRGKPSEPKPTPRPGPLP